MESLTVFVGAGALLLLRGRLLSRGTLATAADRCAAGGLLGGGLRAACSALGAALLLLRLLLEDVVAVR